MSTCINVEKSGDIMWMKTILRTFNMFWL